MCRINIGHLRVTVGNPRVTRGNHRLNIGLFRLSPGHLIPYWILVNLGLVKVTLWSL